MPGKRKDLERSAVMMKVIKNPNFLIERDVIEKTSMPMDKIKPKSITSISTPTSPRTIKKAPYIEPTVAQNKKAFEFEKRARKNAPTFNEVTTKARLGVNKAAQKAKSITKVQVADIARDIFAIDTEVERDYADPTRVNLGHGSKLGDKKTIRKLDYDGTVLKTKTKQVVSKKPKNNKSGYISINKSKKSRFADEGVESFTNKKTRYRATRDKEKIKNKAKAVGLTVLDFGGLIALGRRHNRKKGYI